MSDYAGPVSRAEEPSWSSLPTDDPVCLPVNEAGFPIYLTPSPVYMSVPEPTTSFDPGYAPDLGESEAGPEAGSEPEEPAAEPEAEPDEAPTEAPAVEEATSEAGGGESAAEAEAEPVTSEAGPGGASAGTEPAAESGPTTGETAAPAANTGTDPATGRPAASPGGEGPHGLHRRSVAPARIGGTSPPRVGEPPPLAPRALEEVRRRSGISLDEHHDRVRAGVARIAQTAHRAQVDIIQLIEGLASALHDQVRADADAIPGFVAGLVARIEARIRLARQAVDDAYTLAGAAIRQMVDETGAGLDTALAINKENVLDLMSGASESVRNLYETTLSAEYQALAGKWAQDIRNAPGQLTPAISEAADDAQAMFEDGGVGQDYGEPKLDLFKDEQRAFAVGPHSVDVLDGLEQQATPRANLLTGSEAEGSFAMGVLAAVDESAVIFDTSEDVVNQVSNAETANQPPRLATPRERALRRLDVAKRDANEGFDQLLESARTSLTRAGRQARDSFRQQAIEGEAALRALAPDMATAWRTHVRQLDPMVPEGRILDWTRLGPVLRRHEAGAAALRSGQARTVRDQERETHEGIDEALRGLRADLQKSAAEIADGVDDVKNRALRRIRLAQEALDPLTAYGQACVSNAETWATDTDEGLDADMLARITKQARDQLSGSDTSLENTFFKTQYDDFVKVCEEKRDALYPDAASPDPIYLTIGDNVERLVERKAQSVHTAGVKDDGIVFGATDEDMMLQALMGLTNKGMDAVRERFANLHYGDLDSYVLGELDDDSTEKRAGARLLQGDNAGALEDIVAAGLSWATTEEALLNLSADDVTHLQNSDGWASLVANLDSEVHGTNNAVAHALLEGDRERAAALRLEADATAARSRDDVSATLDVAASVESVTSRYLGSSTAFIPRTQRERQAFTDQMLVEHAVLVGSAAPDEVIAPDRARTLFADHVTRTFTTIETETYSDMDGGGGSYDYEVTHALSTEDADRIRAVIEHPEDSALVQATRTSTLVNQMGDGGSDAQLVTLVDTAEDRELHDATRDLERIRRYGTREQIQEAEQRLAAATRHHQEYLQHLARQLGADASTLADPGLVEQYVSERLARAVGNREGFGQTFAWNIAHSGRADLLSATMIATQDSGTNEALLDATYADRTWEEFDQLRVDFATREGDPTDLGALDRHLGTFGGAGFGTELSGDDRQRIERLMVLDAGSDRGIAAAAMLDYTHTQQNGVAGRASVSGGAEDLSNQETQNQLQALIRETASAHGGGDWAFDAYGRPNPAAFGPDGNFLGDRERLHAFGTRAESRREAYNAAVDRAESFWTSLIQALGTLLAAVVLIVGSFVPGLNVVLWLAVGALVTGVLLIATKMAFRGERYGWEEMMVDVGTTVVDVALAAAGGRGAAQMMKQGVKQSLGMAVRRGAVMGFAGAIGHAALQERTWEGGVLAGLGELFVAGAKGAAVGAATEFLSVGIANKLGPAVTAEVTGAHNILADMAGDTIGQFAGSLLGTGLDAATGHYGGSFAQAMENAAFSALFEGLASPIRAAGFRRFNARTSFPGMHEGYAAQTRAPTPEQVRALYHMARDAGQTRGMTFEAFAADFQNHRAAIQARRSAALGDLPDALRAQFDGVGTDALESLHRAARDGGDSAELLARLQLDNPDATPAQVKELAQKLLDGIHAARERSAEFRRSVLAAVPPELSATLSALSTASLARLVDAAHTEGGPTAQDRFRWFREAQARHPGLESGEFMAAVRGLVEAARTARTKATEGLRKQRTVLLGPIPNALRGPFARLPLPALAAVHDLVVRGSFGTDEQRAAIVAQVRAVAPDLEPAAILRAFDDAVRSRTPQTATGPVRAAILDAVPPHLRGAFEGVDIEIVPVHVFEARTRSRRARAVVEFEDGRPRVLVRADADLAALREEGLHLLQARDPEWRTRIGQLDETRMRAWDQLTVDEQVAMYRTKLEVEIDAQRRLIAELRSELDASPATQARLAAAETTLENLQRRMVEVDAMVPEGVRAIREGASPRPDYLDQPPRLFNKVTDVTAERLAQMAETVKAAREGNLAADTHATNRLRGQATEAAPDITHAGVTYTGVLHVQGVYGHVTLGAGFAAIGSVTTRFGFDPARDLVIGGPNPWDTTDNLHLGQKTTGQVDLPNAHVPFEGTVKEPGPDHYAMAREHGDHVAVNRHQLGIAVTAGHIVRVELASAGTTGWPPWASGAKARILVGDAETGPYRWVYAEGVDHAMGPGPGRIPKDFVPSAPPWDPVLAAALTAAGRSPTMKMDAATVATLLQQRRILTADQGTNIVHFLAGKDVAIFGGTATGAWVTAMGAMSAAHVEWVGFTRDLDHINGLPEPRRSRLIAAWTELATTGTITNLDAAADLQNFVFREQRQNGFLVRNQTAEAHGIYSAEMAGRITWSVATNLKSVDFDGNRFVIRYEGDPRTHYKDQVVFAIGQDPMRAGASGHVLDPALRGTLEPIWSKDGARVLGLQSPDGSFRIMGMAATMPDIVRAFVQRGLVDDTLAALRVAGDAIPDIDSKGVIGGFYHANRMISELNTRVRLETAQAMLPPHLAATPVMDATLPPGVHVRVDWDPSGPRLEVSARATPADVRAAIADLEKMHEARRAIRELLSDDERAAIGNPRIEIWDDAAYATFTQSQTSHAAVIIKNGEPVVIVRRGADLRLLAEEGFHVHQVADLRTTARALRLDEATIANWPNLSVREKLDLYRIQIDLEIDAQKRVIRALEARVGAEPELAERIAQARTNIEGLRDKQIGFVRRLLMRIGWLRTPEWLSQPARLFAKASLQDQAAIKATTLGDRGAAFQRFVELYATTSKRTATIDRLLEAFHANQVWDPVEGRFHTERLVDVHKLPDAEFTKLLKARFPDEDWPPERVAALRDLMRTYLDAVADGMPLAELVAEFGAGRRFDPDTARFGDPNAGETVAQNRKRLIEAIGETRWQEIQDQARAKFGTDLKAIVPIEGVFRLRKKNGNALTFGDVFDRNADTYDKIHDLVRKALVAQGRFKGAAAAEEATRILDILRASDLVLVKGTDHVRAADDYDKTYRNNATKLNLTLPGKTEVHHLHPLYLGGGHLLENLIALDGTPHGIHDQMHALFDSLLLPDGGLNANSLQSRYADKLQAGYGVVLTDGTVIHHLVDEPP